MIVSLKGIFSQKAVSALVVTFLAPVFVLTGFSGTGRAQEQTVIEAELLPMEEKTCAVSRKLLAEESIAYASAITNANNDETASIESQDKTKVTATATPISSPVSEYSNKALATVDDFLNIRNLPSTEGEIIGKMYKGGGGDIVEHSEGWTKLKSGSIEGWVSDDYLVFGEKIETYAKEIGILQATVTTETLKVREAADAESSVLGLVAQDEKYSVLEEGEEWVKIQFTDDSHGYISAEYTEVDIEIGKAITPEEDLAIRKAAEAKTAAGKVKNAAAQDEINLLAACVMMEAGNSYEGQLAVANVVINRVNSGLWGSSITSVIYAKGQFPGASNGKLNQFLANGPSAGALQAVNDALNGVNNVGDYLYFNMISRVNYESCSQYVIIGGNCFYKK